MGAQAKLKISDLKKELKGYDQKELIQLITDLYKLNEDVQDYLAVKMNREDTVSILYEKAQKEILNEFFPTKGFGKMRLAKAKKAITDFKKVTGDHENTISLMLYYVETGTEFTNAYGDIDGRFYDSMLSVYHNVIVECEKDRELFMKFRDRLYEVVAESEGIGWGYHHGLTDYYDSISWLEEES
ncbi:DUF6155 family protein [Oceanobacillus saliphilus]|uniref:DUF6155 family protein n=1 Tax=Oceanobacillus saliphilus TaxID=2925834 RepID=UPI00201DC36B|nr:DUF6155 family protein [Oceanobacillus saliphilus]